MIHFAGKILLCCLLIGVSPFVSGEQIVPPVERVPPVDIAGLPTDITDKSPEELANLMTHIAGWSYQTLQQVPKRGLQAQQASLEQIIALRKWLESQKHPLFQLLAFRLITGVDQAIFNEIFRQEMVKHEIPISTPPILGSFDDPLLKRLLALNEVVENQVIDYALSLDGKIAAYCQEQNYPLSTYLNGLVLRKFSDEMDDYGDSLRDAVIELLFSKLSKPLAADWLFVQSLEIIDKKRDIRLISEIYFEKGLPKDGKIFEQWVLNKWGKVKRKRLSTGFNTTTHQVMNTLLAYVEHKPSRRYGEKMTFLFIPFLKDINLTPASDRHRTASRKFKSRFGQWVTFLEDNQK